MMNKADGNIDQVEPQDLSGRGNAESCRLLVEHCTDLIWNMNAEGVLLDVSPSWVRVTGHEPSALTGASFVALVHKDDAPACLEYLRSMVETRQIVRSPEYRMMHADGAWHWHFATGSPVTGPNGEFVSAVSVSSDITERKQREEELRKSEQLFRFLSENTQDIVWQQDADMRFTYINDAYRRILDCPREEFIGTCALDYFTPEGLKIVGEFFAERKKSLARGELNKTMVFEAPMSVGDGKTFWAEVSTTPMCDDSGKIAGYNGIMRNIDKRKQAEAEREKLIAELQAAVDKVKQLEGILRICSNCKKICDENGKWLPMETYISARSEADFSHGICPGCMKKLYPDYLE